MAKDSNVSHQELKIVGIGASASGLQALDLFFSKCPSNTGFSFVIIQHLSPDLKSAHDTLLARKTSMPVLVATNLTVIEPNHVYLIPSTRNIILQGDTFKLIDRAPEHQLNFPIDIFFSSLAEQQLGNAVGIILSGSGSDGTKGAAAIKEVGGLVIVQHPEESGFSGMPLSVIGAGLADFVLKAAQIPPELIAYFNEEDKTDPKEDERLVDQILELIKKETKYDFTTYRRQTLQRRIIKRKNINKLEKIADYKTYLEKNAREQDILAGEFLIGVTRFFRDKAHFDTIKEKVIPEIIAGKAQGETIKLWVIGCVTGEEAYSLAMLMKEALINDHKNLTFKIFATDINTGAIEKASKGHFGLNIAFDVEAEYLAKYFKREDKGFAVLPHLRKHIVFSNHDILHNPPFNKMDLISCRNLLIYFQNSAQEKTLKNILYALNRNGYLFLGSSESLGIFARNFEVIDHRGKIFKKLMEYDGNPISNDIFYTSVGRIPSKKVPEFTTELTIQLAKRLALVTNSVCICINENFQIIETHGSLRLVCSLPPEGFSNNLLRLLPREFQVPVTTAIRMLSKSSKEAEVITKLINFSLEDKIISAKIVFDRFEQRSYPHEKFYLIAITVEDLASSQLPLPIPQTDSATNTEIQQLQTLLDETNENLQLTIEELESSNEEAQATNEELVSSNEELQSTNEELQSVNEELYTVNVELQEKNIKLLELNSDIENLINSSPIASLFLDSDLQIRKFTPSIGNIISLEKSDIGRSIASFSLPNQHFLEDINVVVSNKMTRRKKIITDKDKWYLQEIHSYISAEDRNTGVVINYTDITDFTRVSAEMKEKSKFLKGILQLFPGNFYIYDLEEHRNIFSNHSFEELTGYSAVEIDAMEEEVNLRLSHPDDLDKIREYYEKVRDKNKTQTLQHRLITRSKKTIWVERTDQPFEYSDSGQVKTTLGFLTERKVEPDKTLQAIIKDAPRVLAAMNVLRAELKDKGNTKIAESLTTIESALQQLKKESDNS